MTRQQERILIYMEESGSITPLEAFAELGVTKLATRVSELRREGIPIVKSSETRKNRFGETVTYARYSLPQDKDTIANEKRWSIEGEAR